jgi:predicted metalloprotease
MAGALVAAITVCATLGACSSVLNGTPQGGVPRSGVGPTSGTTSGTTPPTTPTTPTTPPSSRAPAPNTQLPVQGLASGTCPDINTTSLDAVCFDTITQNALSDVMDFWKVEYPKIANGQPLPPLKGGLYSVDGLQIAETGHATPPATGDACIAHSPAFIVDNGAFCQLDDSIAWDRNPNHLFAQLADHYGPFLVALIFAHEFGHAISYRLGVFNKGLPTVDTESQADCAAGAWAAYALAGEAAHFPNANQDTLDNALEGFLDGRDGTPNTPQDVSHGNGFDRLSAIADGIQNGASFCYSDTYFNRTFTERPFSDPKDYAAGGNESLGNVLAPPANNSFVEDLNRFWSTAAQSINKTWKPVTIQQADHPACESSGPSEFDYCPTTNTVYYSQSFAEQAYNSVPAVQIDNSTGNATLVFNQPADYALGNLFSLGWGLAVRAQFFSGSMDNQAALIAAACYTGAYSKDINLAQTDPAAKTKDIVLSPSDLDEAVSSMLDLVPDPKAFGARGTTGLERIQAFVKGYFGGLHAC